MPHRVHTTPSLGTAPHAEMLILVDYLVEKGRQDPILGFTDKDGSGPFGRREYFQCTGRGKMTQSLVSA